VKIIKHWGAYPGICTTLTATGRDNIPEGYLLIGQPENSHIVGKMAINLIQGFDYLPEMILWVPVIFMMQE